MCRIGQGAVLPGSKVVDDPATAGNLKLAAHILEFIEFCQQLAV